MTNSGGYNNVEETVAEAQEDGANDIDDKAVTESGEISIDTDSNEVFSDSVPGEENSAADDDDDDDGKIDNDDKESAID